MPCLNEAETLKVCIDKVIRCLNENDVIGEVIIAANGSPIGNQKIDDLEEAWVVMIDKNG